MLGNIDRDLRSPVKNARVGRGCILVSINPSGQFHTGCARTELPYFHGISAALFGVCLVMTINYIAVEAFLHFGQQKKIYERLLLPALLPLVYLTYQVARYPYVDIDADFLGRPSNSAGAHNPLTFIGALYAVALGWTILRFSVKTDASGKRTIIGYVSVSVFLLTDALMYLTAKYVTCFE